jgi:hypothetical protein
MELVDLMLGEEADAELVRAGEAAARGGEAVGQELGERRLALAIAAEKRDAVVLVDAQVEVVQDDVVAVAHGRILGHDDGRLSSSGSGKVKTVRASSSGRRIVSILASILTRDWACLALDALALKRSTKAWRWARRSSCFLAWERRLARCSARWRANWS